MRWNLHNIISFCFGRSATSSTTEDDNNADRHQRISGETDTSHAIQTFAPPQIYAPNTGRHRSQALQTALRTSTSTLQIQMPFSLTEAQDETKPFQLLVPLGQLFDELDQQDIKEIFGNANEPLRGVATNLVENIDANGRTILKGSVVFVNYYGESTWVMSRNYKDSTLAPFYMNDIIKHQTQCAGVVNGPQFLVRKDVQSIEGRAFFERHPSLVHKSTMNAEQLSEFIKLPANGKSSVRILRDWGRKAVGARVLVQPDEDDKSKKVYSVVLITGPADQVPADSTQPDIRQVEGDRPVRL